MRIEVNSTRLESKVFNGKRSEKNEYKYMASLQLNGKHICSSSLFQVGFLLTSNNCARHIGYTIQKKRQKGTAVLGDVKLKNAQRIFILSIAFYEESKPFDEDVGVIMVNQLKNFDFEIPLFMNCV